MTFTGSKFACGGFPLANSIMVIPNDQISTLVFKILYNKKNYLIINYIIYLFILFINNTIYK